MALRDVSNEGRYLIITVESLVDSVAILADAKREDYSVKVVTKTEILSEFPTGAEDNSILDFLRYASLNWADHPQWVVLAGDLDTIPTHIEPYETGYMDNLASDHYYANLAGDLAPELSVSRLPTSDPALLKALCLKAVNFKFKMGDWVNRIVLIAYQSSGYISCKDAIFDLTSGEFDATKRYAGPSSKQDVINALDNGAIIANYRGHGSSTSWSSSNGLNNTDVTALMTDSVPPMVTSICCWNSRIDMATECFAEAWMRNEKSVAFLGASRPSYTIYNHSFDRYLFEAIMRGIHKPGTIMNWAKSQLLLNDDISYSRDNIRMYLLMGDPELDLFEVALRPAKIYWDLKHDTDYDRIGPGYHYENLANRLRALGHVIDDKNLPISSSSLIGYDVLIIPDPEIELTSSEIAEIQTWVRQGHGLFVLCENEAAFHGTSVNQLLSPYRISASGAYPPARISRFESHPVTECVHALDVAGQAHGELSVSGLSIALARKDDGKIIIAAAEYEKGKVVVTSDSDTLKNNWIHSDGYIFAINTIRWLQRYGGKGRRISDLWVEYIQGVGPEYGQQLTANGVLTVGDLSLIDPTQISTVVNIPLFTLFTLKTKAQLAINVRFDKTAFEYLMNWELGRIFETSVDELCHITGQAMSDVLALKMNIGILIITLDNSLIRPLKLGHCITG